MVDIPASGDLSPQQLDSHRHTGAAGDAPRINLDSSSLSYTASLPNSIDRPIINVFDDYVSVKDFGAIGDGVADDTIAINNGINSTTAVGKKLFFPSGTYITSGINGVPKMTLIGENSKSVIIKQKAGSTNGIISCGSNTDVDDVVLSSLTFDGNFSNGTSGDTITLYGCRPLFYDINVNFSAGNAIVTNANVSDAARLDSQQGSFTHIYIDSPQKSGWVHNGPSDSNFVDLIICDPSLAVNNGHYGLLLNSNGNFYNFHPSNRYNAPNIPIAMLYIAPTSTSNTFSNCNIEGGIIPAVIASTGNKFTSCGFFAPRGAYCVNLLAGFNSLQGCSLGDNTAYMNPNYAGILLSNCGGNLIDLVDLNATNGAINFGNSTGNNIIRVVGYKNTTGAQNMIATPHVTDDVLIKTTGICGINYRHASP
jgi:hypothetical protein